MDIFTSEIKEGLEIAQKLRLAGMYEPADAFCRRFVKQAAQRHGVDILELFYGKGVYDKINGESEAAEYIFIAKCAGVLYDQMLAQNPASRDAGAWAIRDITRSQADMREFFEWLSRSRREPIPSDVTYFKRAMRALSNPSRLFFKMRDRVANYSLVEIVKGLTNGRVTIKEGELQ